MRQLTKFEITPTDENFVVRLEGEEGEPAEFLLTADQLDALIESADELLEEDDSAFEVDDGETYQKPLG